MESQDWALSPPFLHQLGKVQRAFEVQALIEEHLHSRARRKARRLDRATRKAEAEAMARESAGSDSMAQ